jgi:hypothetical protein
MLLSITPHHHYNYNLLQHFNPKSSPSTAAHCSIRTVSISNNNNNGERDDVVTVSSAAAVAAAIRKASSSSPVEFVERIEEEKMDKLPSCDFQTLCVEQLDLFRRIVHPDANLSV